MSNILEEYLVKIGAQIDRNAFNGANQAIVQLTRTVQNLGSVLKIGAIASLFAKIAESIVKNIKAVADLDMEYRKLANSMWVTKETAKSLKVAMETMGASEQDIAWIPELREQFFRLRQEMNALATPSDADGQLSWIRQIEYDIQSLQVKLKMLREWIVYYLIKYLQPYIAELQKFIRWISGKLGENMPKIAQKIASALAGIVSLMVSLGKFIRDAYNMFVSLGDRIPSTLKKVVAAFAIAGAAIMMSPFGLMLTAIGGALLLLEDFYYYIEGKKSSRTLAPMWEMLVKFANGEGSKAFGFVKTGIDDIAKGISDITKGIGNLIKKLNLGRPDVERFFNSMARAISFAIKQLGRGLSLIGKIMSAIALALDNDFRGAAKIAGEAFIDAAKGQLNDIKSLFGYKPQSMQISAGDNPNLDKLSDSMKAAEPFIGGMLNAMGIENPLITSGYRSPEHNAAVGGVEDSYHTHGEALDIYLGNISEQDAKTIKKRFEPYFEEVQYHDAGSGKHLHLAKYLGGFDGGYGGAGAGGGFGVSPDSYAAKGAPSVPATAMLTSGGSTSYNTSSNSYGNIIVNINGAQDPRTIAQEVQKVISYPQSVIQANHSKVGGVGA